MPTNMVNLDALIRKEDFEVQTTEKAIDDIKHEITASNLEEKNLIFKILRKPDFQRETANWTPEKVADLVKCFVEGDLIPAIILWRSLTGNIFVIDGAHRLSALIAWVHNDYGDGKISRQVFQNFIPPEQQAAADKTRALIARKIGSYETIMMALDYEQTTKPEQVRFAKNIAVRSVNSQWVTGGASKAEASFFKINQQFTPIDPTELQMIKGRQKANALAARAILHSGSGHKYWSAFEPHTQTHIEQRAKEIYQMLFIPALEVPLKTLEIPVAGQGYSPISIRLVFEFVNLTNDLLKKEIQDKLPADKEGFQTIEFLERVKRISSFIASNEPNSLGLHPAVYFYSATGRFQPTAFLATTAFVKELKKHKSTAFPLFTKHREKFEDFLLQHGYFINQIVNRYGSGLKGYPHILKLYQILLDSLVSNKNEQEIISILQRTDKLRFLKDIPEEEEMAGRANFSTETKNIVYLRKALEATMRCQICGARMPKVSISLDHIIPMRDGGKGTPENAQLAHMYCNSGYKEYLESLVEPF